QNTEGPGLALWGVEPQTGKVKWRTILGTPWPSPLTLSRSGDRLTALGADGAPIALTADDLKRRGFVASPLPGPGPFRVPAGARARLDGDGFSAIVPKLGAARVLVRPGASGPFREVALPVPVGARPVAWGKELLLPGGDGRAYLVDPLTG